MSLPGTRWRAIDHAARGRGAARAWRAALAGRADLLRSGGSRACDRDARPVVVRTPNWRSDGTAVLPSGRLACQDVLSSKPLNPAMISTSRLRLAGFERPLGLVRMGSVRCRFAKSCRASTASLMCVPRSSFARRNLVDLQLSDELVFDFSYLGRSMTSPIFDQTHGNRRRFPRHCQKRGVEEQ